MPREKMLTMVCPGGRIIGDFYLSYGIFRFF